MATCINKRSSLRLATIAGLIWACFCPADRCVAEEPIKVGHVLGLRNPEMTKEYRIAIELMMKRVFAGFGVVIEVKAFNTPEEELAAFWDGTIDVAEISALDYVAQSVEQQEAMELVGTVAISESKTKRYELLATPGTKLEKLEGQPIHVVGRGEWNVGRRWLDIEIRERFGKSADEFFGDITVIDYEDPNEAILPAFFGKSKACMVIDSQLELLSELNPQISQRLKPIIVSPEMLGVLFAMRADFGAARLERLRSASERLHETADGQQAFTLMKIVRLERVVDDEFSNMRSLIDRARGLGADIIAILPTGEETNGGAK